MALTYLKQRERATERLSALFGCVSVCYSAGYRVYGIKNNQFIGLWGREKGSTFAKVFRDNIIDNKHKNGKEKIRV